MIAPEPDEDAVEGSQAPRPIRIEAIYEALREHRVDYLTIGGVAVQAHGHPRTTQDLDLLVAPDPANLERLAAALKELRAALLGVDAHLLGIDPTDPKALREGANFTLRTSAGDVDLWTDPAELPGARSWEELRAAALELDVPGVGHVRVVGRDDLIRLKQAAAALEHRPEAKRRSDLEDISVLEAVRRAEQKREIEPPEIGL